MQGGILIEGRNPKSKAEIKRAVADGLSVTFYDTSAFNNQGSFPITQLPAGNHTFVGPDPYTKRNFYGSISNGKIS